MEKEEKWRENRDSGRDDSKGRGKIKQEVAERDGERRRKERQNRDSGRDGSKGRRKIEEGVAERRKNGERREAVEEMTVKVEER